MRFPVSPHCDGRRFFNPGLPFDKGLLAILRWKLGAQTVRWPRNVSLAPQPPPPAPAAGRIVATWINHSTFLLQTPGLTFLTDPVYSARCAPRAAGPLGPRRAHAPGLAFEQLPRIDVVLLSHNHYDHADFDTLRRLAATHAPRALTPSATARCCGPPASRPPP